MHTKLNLSHIFFLATATTAESSSIPTIPRGISIYKYFAFFSSWIIINWTHTRRLSTIAHLSEKSITTSRRVYLWCCFHRIFRVLRLLALPPAPKLGGPGDCPLSALYPPTWRYRCPARSTPMAYSSGSWRHTSRLNTGRWRSRRSSGRTKI